MNLLAFITENFTVIGWSILFFLSLVWYLYRFSKARILGDLARDPSEQMKEVLFFTFLLGIGFIWLINFRLSINGTSLTGLVDTVKLFSLVASITIGGEIAGGIKPNQKLIRSLNYLGLVISIVICGILVIKVLNNGHIPMAIFASDTNEAIEHYFVYATVFPIVWYTLIDVLILTKGATPADGTDATKNRIENEKITARRFFVYADIPAALPLILVFSVTMFQFVDFTKIERDVFLSGAMAIVILSHTLGSKAVDVYNPVQVHTS